MYPMYPNPFRYGSDALIGTSIVAAVFIWIFVFLAVYAIIVIPKWFLFEKAGQPGWAAIIPYYNDYVLFDITWGNGILFLLTLIPFAGAVIWIITRVKMAEAFGKGAGWACGLIFLYPIFLYIMAFSKDIVYVGVPGQQVNYGNANTQQGYQNPYSQGYGQQTYTQSNVKYCVNCGNRLVNNEKFCPKCGKEQ